MKLKQITWQDVGGSALDVAALKSSPLFSSVTSQPRNPTEIREKLEVIGAQRFIIAPGAADTLIT